MKCQPSSRYIVAVAMPTKVSISAAVSAKKLSGESRQMDRMSTS